MTHFGLVLWLSLLLTLAGTQQLSSISITAPSESNVAGFEMIEDYLQKRVNNEDTESNMDAVKDLLFEQLYKPEAHVNPQLLAALEMFVNLEKLTRITSCNRYGHDFLIKLKAATNYRIDRRTTKRRRFYLPLRRIELLMSRFALIHAQRCQVVYKCHFARQLMKYNLSKLDSMDAFIGSVIDDRFERNLKAGASVNSAKARVWRIYANLIARNDSLKRRKDAELALSLMISKSGDQFNSLPEKELREQVRAWFRIHLLGPCEDYLSTMGRDIFMPAELDTRIMDKADKIKPNSDEQHNRFVDGWIRFGLCKILERDQHILIKNVVSLLTKQRSVNQD